MRGPGNAPVQARWVSNNKSTTMNPNPHVWAHKSALLQREHESCSGSSSTPRAHKTAKTSKPTKESKRNTVNNIHQFSISSTCLSEHNRTKRNPFPSTPVRETLNARTAAAAPSSRKGNCTGWLASVLTRRAVVGQKRRVLGLGVRLTRRLDFNFGRRVVVGRGACKRVTGSFAPCETPMRSVFRTMSCEERMKENGQKEFWDNRTECAWNEIRKATERLKRRPAGVKTHTREPTKKKRRTVATQPTKNRG